MGAKSNSVSPGPALDDDRGRNSAKGSILPDISSGKASVDIVKAHMAQEDKAERRAKGIKSQESDNELSSGRQNAANAPNESQRDQPISGTA